MGALLMAAAAAALPELQVAAKGGGGLRLLDIDVGEDFAGVYQNQIVSMKFSAPVDRATVKPATFRFRVENSTGTGLPIDVPGTFQVAGSTVRFFPRLPTHLRDPG